LAPDILGELHDTATRQQAATMMQMSHPGLIDAGIQQKQDYLMGITTTKRPKDAPQIPTSN
jgi:hypothetical protein